MNGSYCLERFVEAQADIYECVLAELKQGRKNGHWMWFIFPQVTGLGRSRMAQHYAIRDRQEALDYLSHPILGKRLLECCRLLVEHNETQAVHIFGGIDSLKLRSCMTLFDAVSDQQVFGQVLAKFFESQSDPFTLSFLSHSH